MRQQARARGKKVRLHEMRMRQRRHRHQAIEVLELEAGRAERRLQRLLHQLGGGLAELAELGHAVADDPRCHVAAWHFVCACWRPCRCAADRFRVMFCGVVSSTMTRHPNPTHTKPPPATPAQAMAVFRAFGAHVQWGVLDTAHNDVATTSFTARRPRCALSVGPLGPPPTAARQAIITFATRVASLLYERKVDGRRRISNGARRPARA